MTGVTRKWWLLLTICMPVALCISAQSLLVRLDGDLLHITAPQLQFLNGKPLERLHDGLTVAFLAQLTLSTDANATIRARSIARFALSYDIWEQRFSVTRLGAGRRSASNLSERQAEAWCLENLALDRSSLPPDRPFWVRLDLRAEDSLDQPGVVGEPGISLTRLVEIFSRPAREKQPHWVLDLGPLQVHELNAPGLNRGDA